MYISEVQIVRLRKIFPDTADVLLQREDINILLDALDDEILNRFDANYDPTPESDEVEHLRDEIYWGNTH